VPRGATTVRVPAPTGCNGHVDEEDEVTVLDVVGPELERCSVLADRLARLLLPESLFS
jgi:hypothetical protein